MLDFFAIFGQGGIVLWAFQETQQMFAGSSVNALIRDVFLQERGNASSIFKHDGMTLKFKMDNEFELVFLVAYQSVVQLTYADKLLTDVQREFRDRYKNVLSNKQHLYSLCGTDHFDKFKNCFHKCLRLAETDQIDVQPKQMRTFAESDKSQKTVASMIISEPTDNKTKKKEGKNKVNAANPSPTVNETALNTNTTVSPAITVNGTTNGNATSDMDEVQRRRQEMMMRKGGGVKKKETTTSAKKSAESSPQPTKGGGGGGKKGKANRVWALSGKSDDAAVLDYSSAPPTSGDGDTPEEQTFVIQQKEFVGTMKGELAGLDANSQLADDDEEEEDEEEDEQQEDVPSSGGFSVFSAFKSLVGNKKLTRETMSIPLDKMREHLIAKNVASDIAEKLVESVATKLEGKVVGTFRGVKGVVQEGFRESLIQLLTPKRRVDILRDVVEAKGNGRPYVIVFCGVNGVGKSTNLAKITFWLNENGLRVLIAAGDTFRAGAVEQLRTHTRHLNALHSGAVTLFEQGYGKDPAAIAQHAINYAVQNDFDVVLVDTAGRMQDNEPLMRALSKLINLNDPDAVLFVGEALVGNEAVDQLVKFNQALADHAPIEKKGRLIDGIVLTKFDTIDDMVGAAISMTYITGQPIVFVGTGQTYGDLKNLNANAVVNMLLK